MWKKDDEPAPSPVTAPPEPTKPRNQTHGQAPAQRATIGQSITIRGEVTGNEDLLIQGRVDGTVHLERQEVTVGQDGKVKADVAGRLVVVEGEVQGDIHAAERIILRSTAKVQGDLKAPRVVLEDGANFRGGVDMGDPVDPKKGAGGLDAPGAPATAETKDGTTGSGMDPVEAAHQATT